MKSPESGDQVVEVRAAPLEHAQEMDRRVRVVVSDVLGELLDPVDDEPVRDHDLLDVVLVVVRDGEHIQREAGLVFYHQRVSSDERCLAAREPGVSRPPLLVGWVSISRQTSRRAGSTRDGVCDEREGELGLESGA